MEERKCYSGRLKKKEHEKERGDVIGKDKGREELLDETLGIFKRLKNGVKKKEK